MKLAPLLALLFLVGCAVDPKSIPAPVDQPTPSPTGRLPDGYAGTDVEYDVRLPIEGYAERRTFKAFGEYIQDRFRGYHVADDIEYTDSAAEIPVYAIADGVVAEVDGFVSGYGGFMRTTHALEGKTINAIYGHLDLRTPIVRVGDVVEEGDVIAYLGKGGTRQTDGERKHLHFALYEGDDVRRNGYESRAADVSRWINPQDFFIDRRGDLLTLGRSFPVSFEPRGPYEKLSFVVPEDMEVEYVPSIQSLNIYALYGDGTARERSQIFIRFFDASQFLTLPIVTIHRTDELTIGRGGYTARRYDIEKKAGAGDFPDQPAWRNVRHIVTDARAEEGLTRYVVIAKNPELDMAVYESFVGSIVLGP